MKALYLMTGIDQLSAYGEMTVPQISCKDYSDAQGGYSSITWQSYNELCSKVDGSDGNSGSLTTRLLIEPPWKQSGDPCFWDRTCTDAILMEDMGKVWNHTGHTAIVFTSILQSLLGAVLNAEQASMTYIRQAAHDVCANWGLLEFTCDNRVVPYS